MVPNYRRIVHKHSVDEARTISISLDIVGVKSIGRKIINSKNRISAD